MKASHPQRLRSLQALPKQELVDLLKHGQSRTLAQNEVLIEQGSKVPVACLLAQGHLVAELPQAGGARRIGEIRPGEVAGEGALSRGDWTAAVQVRATEPSTVVLLSPQLFEKTRGTRALAALQGHLIGVLAKRIQGTNLQLRQAWQEQRSADSRSAEPSPRDVAPLTLSERLSLLLGVSR